MAKIYKRGKDVPIEQAGMLLQQLENLMVRIFGSLEYSCIELIFGGEWYEYEYRGDSVAKQKLYIKNLKKLNDFKLAVAELFLVFGFPMLINKPDEWYFEGDTEMGDIKDAVMISIRDNYNVIKEAEEIDEVCTV